MYCLLVVDDDPRTRDLVRAALVDAGHLVLAARDAHEALRLALRYRIDAAVVGMVLPDYVGADIARALHSVAGYTRLPVIGLCDHPAAARVPPAQLDAACLLVKPVSDQALLRAVEGCLGGDA